MRRCPSIVFAVLLTSSCGPSAPHAMVGVIAPRVTVATLDGGAIDLIPGESNVVILDFWASWCGPCRFATPAAADVARTYGDRGVELVAVNVGEDPATVRDFVRGKDLASHVVLDMDGRVSTDFKADGLPTIMLIDRAGVVQAVYEGYYQGLFDDMNRDVLRILEGQSLAPKPAAS